MLWVLALAYGCGGGEGASLLIDLRSDLLPGVELDEVAIDLQTDEAILRTYEVQPFDDLQRGVRVASFEGMRAGAVRVRARLFTPDGARLGERELAVEVRGTTVATLVFTRSCRGVVCPDGDPTLTACQNGVCVAPECSPENPEACGAARCVGSSECVAPVGACAEAMCIEGACFDVPRSGACGAAEVCLPDLGCIPRDESDAGSGMDADVPDAGAADADVDAGAPCDEGAACPLPDPCAVGRVRCDGGTPTCEAEPAEAGTPCRPSAGPCDAEETCDGIASACPADTFVAAGTTCRAAAGTCDAAEVCDGESAACPDDARRPTGTACRPAASACDAEETCDGVGVDCPADEAQAAGTTCRAAAGECDSVERCDGVRFTCPDDAFVAAGTTCSGGRVCDGSGACLDLGCGDPCTTGNACEIGIIDCGGGMPVCVRDRLRDPGFVCRPSAGPCDAEESCTGSAPTCPADTYRTGTECRPSGGPCDVAELCDGMGPGCPADAVRPGGFECRGRVADCDVPETCDGSAKTCPADAFATGGTVCRGSRGPCDLTETCTGSSASCPADAVQDLGFVCRAGGRCDMPEVCDGSSPTCPPNEFAWTDDHYCNDPELGDRLAVYDEDVLASMGASSEISPELEADCLGRCDEVVGVGCCYVYWATTSASCYYSNGRMISPNPSPSVDRSAGICR